MLFPNYTDSASVNPCIAGKEHLIKLRVVRELIPGVFYEGVLESLAAFLGHAHKFPILVILGWGIEWELGKRCTQLVACA